MTQPLDTLRRLIGESLMIPADSIKADDEIGQLTNIDSMSFEMILVAIENETGKAINPTDLMQVRTVGDLAELL